jgi:Hpt domain
MNSAKPRNPTKVTHADHEVITPDHQALRQAMFHSTGSDEELIGRAERALTQLSGEFGNWMNEECERLDSARREVKASGLNETTHITLRRAADDIKGTAQTLGFRETMPIADSLCRLLDHSPDISRISLELIDQHVDAIRAVVREHNRSDVATIATVLGTRLRQVTEEFLVQENRHRPEYLQSIASPPLSPGD